MTTCDIAAITKPWDTQLRAAKLVLAEFFEQGDIEKNLLKIQPQAIMDRDRQAELPSLQLEWIDGICLPLYQSLVEFNCHFTPMYNNILSNREKWQQLTTSCNDTEAAITADTTTTTRPTAHTSVPDRSLDRHRPRPTDYN